MIPVIVIIGRQNVGKSTLFNRLTHTRDSLVANFPGLTRDRQYGHAEWLGFEFIIIDTGGFDSNEKDVAICTAKQSLIAIEEADVVMFMVDGRAGLMAADQKIAQDLRNRKKSTVIVVNKTDGINIDSAVSDFYSIGIGKIFAIAAAHGYGVNQLLEEVIVPFRQEDPLEGGTELDNNFEPWRDYKAVTFSREKEPFDPQLWRIKLAIVGRPNVGKSTLTNRILGEERVVVCDTPGTTRDSIYIPIVYNGRGYILIDTAGVRKSGKVTEIVEKFSVIKTLRAIKDANVVLLIINAQEGVSDQDLSLLSFILKSGRSIVIVVNKWDGLSRITRHEVKDELDRRLSFISFARIHFISALHSSGIDNLFVSVNEAYQCSTKRISTASMTRIMHMAINEHQPPLVHGRRIKPKYAHAGGYNPPIIVIHGTQLNHLPDFYKRYLMNYFRRSLKIMGSPIYLQFNETINPFISYKNTLKTNKKYNRKHLVQNIKKSK